MLKRSDANRLRPLNRILFLLLTFVACLKANATTYTWDNGGTDSHASTTANWSPDGLPGAGDDVVFSSTSVADCEIDFSWTVNSISIGGTYSGTITQAASQTITTTSGFTIANGAFTGGGSTISVGGDLIVTGGSLDLVSSPLTLSGDLNQSGGTLDLGSGIIVVSGQELNYTAGVFDAGTSTYSVQRSTGDYRVNNQEKLTFYNFTLNLTNGSAGSRELKILGPDNKDTLVVQGALSITRGQIDEGWLRSEGTFLATSPEGGNGGLLFTDGGGARTINLTTGTYPEVILKEVGSTLNVVSGQNITTGSLRILNGTFEGNTGDVTVSGDMTIGGSGVFESTTGILTIGDDLLINSGGVFNHNGGTVEFAGGSTVSITRYGGNEIAFSHLKFSGAGAFEPADTLVCTGSLELSGSGILDLSVNSKNLRIGGDLILTGSGNIEPGNQTITLNGGGTQQLGGAGGTLQVHHLVNSNTSGDVNLAGDIQASGTVSFRSGAGEQFVLNGYDFTIESTGSITSFDDNAYFITNGSGTLIQQQIGATGRSGAIDFPVGYSASSYAPVILQNAGTDDNFSVRVADGIYEEYDPESGALTENVVSMTWHIAESVQGGSSVTLTTQWDAAEESTFDRNNTILSHYDEVSSSWEQLSLPASAGGSDPYTITASGIDDFSPFGVGDDGGDVLPVEWGSVAAKSVDGYVDLSWETHTETNNDYFAISRSDDGVAFNWVGEVDGAGNSASKNSYQFTDGPLTTGVYYYQVTQHDFDGQSSQADQIMVRVQPALKTAGIKVSPNPSNGTNVGVNAFGFEEGEEVLVVLYGPVGQIVYSKLEMTNGNGGIISTIDPTDQLAPGIYIVAFSTSDILIKEKLVVR